MQDHPFQSLIDAIWERRAEIDPTHDVEATRTVSETMRLLDEGVLRIAEPDGAGGWHVNQWLKKAVLLWFRVSSNRPFAGPVDPERGQAFWWDKVPLKTAGWGTERFEAAGFRLVPGSVVRYSAYLARDVVVMPGFVNVGAYVGEGTMVDSWATVGSCAQIGRNCHLSGGVGIGGVLEPLQADPVIIEDDCFIGARSEVVEGVRVGQGAVLSMGVFLSATTKIIDRATGEITVGRVPPYAVVVPGALPGRPLPDGTPGPSLACAVIVKRVDAQTRAKTSINELLRI